MDYTITLSDAQVKAMEYISRDPLDWIENAAVARAFVATREILQKNTEYCNANGVAIAVGQDAQVLQAFELGAVQTAAAAYAEEEARIAALMAESQAASAAPGEPSSIE